MAWTSPVRVERRRGLRPIFRGVRFGEFDFDVCTECGDVIVPKRTALSLEAFAREHGLWGSSSELLHSRRT